MDGYEFLSRIKARWPELPVIMITAYGAPKEEVKAVKAGAFDFLSKPFAPEVLIHVVGQCVRELELASENAALRARAGEVCSLDQIIGECPQMRQLKQLIQAVAQSNATVLILGESGTGKELIAGALHALSPRRRAKYIRINCAAIPETLLESELFGHEKGAFTGAIKQKIGRVEEAHGGTIFLDEIGDMSRALQAKLLRFLEDGTFTRVGGTTELRVDVRLIAATNRDLAQAIRSGQFREDLFHRLNVVQLRAPPLRERGSDILLLAQHFLEGFSAAMHKPIRRISSAAERLLLAYHWPGNVRELRNAIERAVILEQTDEIQPASLPPFALESLVPKDLPSRVPADRGLDELMQAYERELIVRALEQHHYSLARAAAQLKLSRHALRYRMQRLNLHVGTEPEDEAPVPPDQDVSRC
jgi:DNA-binding NtrC family response regulator